MDNKLIKFAAILGLIFLFPSSLNADLGDFHFRVIKTAFMNGYVRAIASDVDTIQSLKDNEDYLRMHVNVQVRKYMQEVSELNRGITLKQGVEDPTPGEPTKTFQRNTAW